MRNPTLLALFLVLPSCASGDAPSETPSDVTSGCPDNCSVDWEPTPANADCGCNECGCDEDPGIDITAKLDITAHVELNLLDIEVTAHGEATLDAETGKWFITSIVGESLGTIVGHVDIKAQVLSTSASCDVKCDAAATLEDDYADAHLACVTECELGSILELESTLDSATNIQDLLGREINLNLANSIVLR